MTPLDRLTAWLAYLDWWDIGGKVFLYGGTLLAVYLIMSHTCE